MKKIAILILAFAAITLTVQAQPQKENRGRTKDGRNAIAYVHRSGGCEQMIPNLSQEQKDEIKKLRLEVTKETTSIRNQIAEKRARLNTLQSEDKADMKAINKTIDEIAALQAQKMKAKANCHVKVRALLNDEQKVDFDSRKFHQNFGRGMGQMKMRSFKSGNAGFEEQKDFEIPNRMGFDHTIRQNFDFE